MHGIDKIIEKEFMIQRFTDLLRHGHYPQFHHPTSSEGIRIAKDPEHQEILYLAPNNNYKDPQLQQFFTVDSHSRTRLLPPPTPTNGFVFCGEYKNNYEKGNFSHKIDMNTGWEYHIYGRTPINKKVVSIIENHGITLNVTQEYINWYEYLNTRQTFLDETAGHATAILYLPILPIVLPAHYFQKICFKIKDHFVTKKIRHFEKKIL